MNENEEKEVLAFLAHFAAQLPNPSSTFALLVRFCVKPGTQAACERAFTEVAGPTFCEPGVLAFNLHRDAGDPTRFVMYECWRSLADLGVHLRSPYITKLRRVLNEMLDGAPNFQVVIPISG